MGAGNILGAIFNTVLASVIWLTLGKGMDVMGKAFNFSMRITPSLQDFANGFSIQQTVWTYILVLVFFVIWLNYLLNENSQASGGV